MKKDFTKASEEHLVSIIKSVEPNNWIEKVGDWFGDIGLTISGWFGNLNIDNYLNNIDEYHKKILDKNNTTIKQLRKIFQTVRSDDLNYSKKYRSEISNSMITPIQRFIDELIIIVEPSGINFNVETVNSKLSSLAEILIENIKKLISPSYINEEDGYYGGNQSNPQKRWKNDKFNETDTMREIVKKYYPDYSDDQIYDLLKEMESEGCGYMALTNTIFKQYIGREKEFEETFGFPMYDENGNPNYDYIMLDLYCSEDDASVGGLYNAGDSSIATTEIVWENYLAKYNVNVDVQKIDNVTVDNVDDLLTDGEILCGGKYRLLNADGTVCQESHKKANGGYSGHLMVITGTEIINGKKMYVVSSWGYKLYIDPSDSFNNLGYQQVKY